MTGKPQSQARGSPTDRQQPESLRLRSLMPTFTVGDIERSVAWYRDGLGFYVAERWEDGGKLKGVMLKAGACELGLSQDDFSQGRDRPRERGFESGARPPRTSTPSLSGSVNSAVS